MTGRARLAAAERYRLIMKLEEDLRDQEGAALRELEAWRIAETDVRRCESMLRVAVEERDRRLAHLRTLAARIEDARDSLQRARSKP